MKLIFSDEFNYEGKPDPEKWTHETGGEWHNDEIQYYTDSLENAFVKNGKLHIVSKKENMGSRHYTSARLTTHGKFSFMHGKVEVSAKLPHGKGSWPAIWMLPDSIEQGTDWPLCGEIDIMEHVGKDENMVHVSLHTESYNHIHHNQETYFEHIEDVCGSFHKYGCEWDEKSIAFLYDDRLVARFYRDYKVDGTPKEQGEKAWPFNQNFHLILNTAVGGFWGGEVDDAQIPYVFEIDYVKIWQAED